MSDTFDLGTDVSGSGSYQGQLASSYTNWVAAQVTGAAEWIAYQWYIGGDATEERLDIAKQIADDLAAGEFSLEDLFLAAQTKGTATLTDIAGTPEPTLLVNGESIDLMYFFGEATALASWSSGPKKLTEHHYREMLTDFESGTPPDGWDEGSGPNQEPTAEAIVINTAETQSVWEDLDTPGYEHTIQNTSADILTANLISDANALDPEGDALSVVANTTTLANGDPLPDYITVVGNTIEIDRNSRELDYLKADPDDPDHSLVLELKYEITDGTNTITNTVNLTITGTSDEYQTSGSGSSFKTYAHPDNPNGEVLSVNLATLPSEGFDFTFTGGAIELSQTGMTGNEKGQISDSGSADWTPTDPLQVGKVGSTQVSSDEASLSGAVLADGVDYNVNLNNAGTGDTMTVTIDYSYDYWYWA